jgi:hypothetical protein
MVALAVPLAVAGWNGSVGVVAVVMLMVVAFCSNWEG